ncbi:MAG: plasmid mobilization relaxosome protein MobC [Proteobacteria bacterium]|nr:plasmid mobilization relaxosome protein MobC [Pseudomonadota bacterium]
MSDLIRESLNRVRTWSQGDRQSYRERTIQVARIGNNLNQIGRWANTYKNTASTIEVVSQLIAIERELKRLIDAP